MSALPETVALTLCPAEKDSRESEKISGLFDIIEHWGYEPSAYVHGPGFIVGRPEDRDNADAPCWWVDESDLIAQVDPHTYGRYLVQEREMSDYYEAEAGEHPYFDCPLPIGESHPDDEDKGHHFAETGREQGWLESFVGPIVAVEVRCAGCGLVKWETS